MLNWFGPVFYYHLVSEIINNYYLKFKFPTQCLDYSILSAKSTFSNSATKDLDKETTSDIKDKQTNAKRRGSLGKCGFKKAKSVSQNKSLVSSRNLRYSP